MVRATFRAIVMGAAGRDFHTFLTFFRDRPDFRVVAFTATQIPFIDARSFPRELAGPGYDADIPIVSERELPRLIRELEVDFVFFAYSDVAHEDVMHRASLVQAAGASFVLLGPRHGQIVSTRPVIAVVAARTGSGKSPVTLALAKHLAAEGRRVAVVRHPMPYGDLRAQVVQRFATEDDLVRAACTVEEREEYEPYIEAGLLVFAGVDYAQILNAAEAEADVVLWDGGNNDTSFYRPTLTIVVVDALRPGHEIRFYPGETNLRSADVVIVNKVSGAAASALEEVHQNVAACAPRAQVIEADLEVSVTPEGMVAGKRVLVVEDGPTTTHGGRPFGAGYVAATRGGAREIIDPRPFARGTIREALAAYPHIEAVLPALGYAPEQLRDLAETIAASGAEVVVDASPARLQNVMAIDIPVARVTYRFAQRSGPSLFALVGDAAMSQR
jgi:predicted GTPase